MADRKADRKRKGKVVSSSSQVIPRFKTLYHEAHFNSKLSARRILPELILQADENFFNPIRFQIHQRKCEKFTKPIQAVGHLMVKEFYANAWEPDKAKRKPLTYTSMVRGTEISFAPSNIKRGAEWVRHRDGRPHYLRRSDLEPMTKGWCEFICRSILPTTNHSELTAERAVLIHSIIIGENINVEKIIAEQIYKFVYKADISSSLPFPSIIAALCADARIPAIPDNILIPQEPPIVAEAMARTRESRAKNPRQTRQATPAQQQPQFQHQQEFPSGFYTHFDTSMSQVYRRLDQQQEENRKSFEAINTRMDKMDDELSFLCYSNQMSNEQMLSPYQNTARQFKEMEMQGILVTMANLAIHRQREEEINQERMRYNQILQEVAAQQAREANKGKTREVVPDSEDKFVSSESEEF
ncbi:hypothetical protein PIB30_087377 [Stylosanthes scabra]|uniref:Putative plant transposon protein domain-containing protein n=1 Tax=Stylosanthes scabra TaxID=79078 RepID=A0ABU6QTY1_9FABA|nr:hypothetical protein [Stylosanthes scabra]